MPGPLDAVALEFKVIKINVVLNLKPSSWSLRENPCIELKVCLFFGLEIQKLFALVELTKLSYLRRDIAEMDK